MGSVFGGGGGGGGSGGDEANTTEKALPSPPQIAATREAFNTASGIAGVAKNLPYYAQIASSPGYRQALQNTANTWSDWMGTAPMDLSQGMAPITHGQFGDVIDAGNIMNEQIAGMSPEVQKILSQWTGPGAIAKGDAYSPAVYDPYVQQKPLLHQGSAAQGGVGTIGAGGIPVSATASTLDAGGTTPPPTGTTTPPPTRQFFGGHTRPAPGSIINRGGVAYRVGQNGRLIRMYGVRSQGGQGGQGGQGQGGFAARGGMQRGPVNINNPDRGW